MAAHDFPASPGRRHALAGLAALLALPALGRLPRALAEEAPAAGELVLYGPPAGPSILLAEVLRTAAQHPALGKLGFKVWHSPDEMRAGLASGSMQAVVLPTQVAANLYNRGLPIRLLDVLTDGLLYVIGRDEKIDSIAALAGHKLAVPFRNDMPDLVMARLLKHAGLVPGRDLEIETTGSPMEAMQMLVAGRVDAALVAEPAATAAITRTRKLRLLGRDVHRLIDVQTAWAEATGRSPILPQAGLALTTKLIEARPQLPAALQAALAAAAVRVNAGPDVAAEVAAPYLDFPAPILAGSIPTSKLVARPARAARGDIEAMLETLAESDAAIIGGKLPDDGFYLL